MKQNKLMLALLAGSALLAYAKHAKAVEFYTPMQPGASTGAPVGALPPPGLYADVDTYELTGNVENGAGKNFGVKIAGSDITAQLLYVPGWSFLGANYGMLFRQPYNTTVIKPAPGPGVSSITGGGLFNTMIEPEILSWNIGGANFVSEGLTLYVPDGDYRHIGTTEAADSVSNNFVTVQPNVAYSYLGGGWNITFNNTFDFDTKDNTTDYQSGDIYYLDGTVAHNFGPWTFGVIGNYIQQFTNDTQFGQAVPNTAGPGFGNRYMHASAGPLVAYQVGKATFTVRYLDGFDGANGGNPSFFHFGVSFPIF